MDEKKEIKVTKSSPGAVPAQEQKEITLEDITRQCMDAPGYVIFVGVLSNKKDDKGNNEINFNYRRSNFSYEDTKKAIDEFKGAFVRDVMSG